MELNAEQIKKALECFHIRILNTNLAEKITETEIMAIVDALSLINELTEKNERLKQKRMNKIDIYKALDILDKFDFFQGQRAGRELWSEKPFEVQEEDLKKFSMDVELLKDFVEDIAHKLKCAELQIEVKERICESYMLQYGTAADKEVWLKKERADTVREMQERLKEYLDDFYNSDEDAILDIPDLIDQIAKEMVEGKE